MFDIIQVESIRVIILLAGTGHPGDYLITLTSPSGIVSVLAEPRPDTTNTTGMILTTHAHYGEDPVGEWTLHIADVVPGNEDSFGQMLLSMFGPILSPPDWPPNWSGTILPPKQQQEYPFQMLSSHFIQ